ncbi:MAG: glycosyltransferase [Candidatus Njordarchaeales archaeon]
MRLALVGFQTWGAKSSELYHIGKRALERGVLKRVLCRFSTERSDIVTKEPLFIRLFELFSSKISKILENFVARYYSEHLLFDLFARGMIERDVDTILFTSSGLVRCLEKAKSMAITTVILHRTLHPQHVCDILTQEKRKFNLNEKSVLIHRKAILSKIKALENCDYIFTLSKLEMQSLCEYGIPDSKIIPLNYGSGVDLNFFRPPKNKPEEPFTVLFLGNKSLIKGVPYLLIAWKKLNIKNAKLIVAGKQNKRLINIFRRAVHFDAVGHVKPLKYYQKAHVFILPSLGEPFPRVVLEAMACGLPVIISNAVGAKEIIKEGKEGFIIPPRDVKAIMDRIQYFYDNPSEIKRMGRNARKKAEQYPWERFSEEVLRKLSELHH